MSPRDSHPKGWGRHGRNAAAALLAALMLLVSPGSSQRATVPIQLQAALLDKVLPYDRNFRERAGDEVTTLLLVARNNGRAALEAKTMRSALGRMKRVGGLPHREILVEYTTATALAELREREKASIVYLASGLSGEIAEIRSALEKTSVLTVSAVAGDVPRGVVLGFDLVSGKPKLLVNLKQAQLQRVNFTAHLLKLAKVFQ